MASLKFTLGMIPSTTKIEQQEKALREEYVKLLSFADSPELARYNELDALVNSAGFRQEQKSITGLTYKGSSEYNREKEYESLAKSREIRLYLKTRDSNELKRFRDIDGSDKITGFEELEKYISSSAFKQKERMKPITFKHSDEYKKFVEYKSLKKDRDVVSYLKKASKAGSNEEKPLVPPKVVRLRELEAFIATPEFRAKKEARPFTFKDTEEYSKLQEYNSLKSSQEIKEYYRFKKSKEYANFRKIDGSTVFAKYEELKAYIATDEFIERKKYLLDKKRFEKTEMHSQLKEYEALKKSDDIVWYFKVKDSNKFDLLKKRELTFSEEFDSGTIDEKRWLTTYFWGDKLLGDRYSFGTDLHIHTEKGNLEIRSSVLTITTKPQKAEGKSWSPKSGFTKKDFAYTSGQINTGKSFRQQYGIFSAKIKLDNAYTKNGFWLLGDTIAPHIDVCRTGKGKIWFDIFRSEKSEAKASLTSKYAGAFYIYTLEWTPDKLVWKVNGEEIFTQTGNIPKEPMYITLAGGVDTPVNTVSNMEIDWIRVYKML